MPISFALPDSITSGKTSNGTAWSRMGSGETLVLLHGVGMNKGVWAPEVNLLSGSFDVLIYDMWGHGESDLPAGELSLTEYTNQLTELLSELKISQAFVAGHSMGGLIAIDFALHYPETCLGMCAINAVFSRTPEQSAAVKRRAQDLADGNITMNITDTLERWFGPTGTHPHAQAEELARNLLEAVNPESYATAYRVFASADKVHASTLHGLAVPALFFTGELDPNSTPAMSEAMAALVPNSHWSVLSGERHMMPLTAAPIVSDAIRDFIYSVSPNPD
jgi:(E)-2-((N-methylformamido)methylene)succinate hydrolase